MRRLFAIKPLGHLLELNDAPLNAPDRAAQWPSKNLDVSANRIVRRWDHYVDRILGTGEVIQQVPVFRNAAGTNTVLVLTTTDLIKVETSPATYSYLTPVHTTNTVIDITGRLVKSGTPWTNVAPGDKFILEDDYDEDAEPNAAWATVGLVVGDTIQLTDIYAGTTGAFAPAKACTCRLLYSVPTGERWSWAVVAGKFCFSSGNEDVQVWTGTGKASALNSTYAKQARILLSFDDRLWMADHLVSGTRNPWMLSWSKIGDPTDWTDSTAGYKEFADTDEPITGLGIVGAMLFVYKRTMYHIGRRTGLAVGGIQFPQDRRGQGLYATNSLVHAQGTNYLMGVDDFYRMNGDIAESVGGPVRKRFFELSTDAELRKVFGMANIRNNQILWCITDTDGAQWMFVFNYIENSWSVYTFTDTVTGFGSFRI